MKKLDLTTTKKCNHKSVIENYNKYAMAIQQAELYLNEGKYDSLRQIATHLELPYNEFYKAFKKYASIDVSIHNNGKQRLVIQSNKNRAKIPPDQKDTIRNLYVDEKYSLRAIGAKYGVSAATVMSFLEHYNIPRRSKSENMRLRINNTPNYSDIMREYSTIGYISRRMYGTKPEQNFEQ